MFVVIETSPQPFKKGPTVRLRTGHKAENKQRSTDHRQRQHDVDQFQLRKSEDHSPTILPLYLISLFFVSITVATVKKEMHGCTMSVNSWFHVVSRHTLSFIKFNLI